MNRALLSVAFLLASLAAEEARAYPTMIAHGYASCATCHVDPSGAGALTLYGRAQSDLLVRWHIDPSVTEEGEPSFTAGSMFGLVPLPRWLDVSGNFRGGALGTVDTNGSGIVVPLLMASDVSMTLDFDRVVAHASVGYGLKNVGPIVAWSPDAGPNNALVSRAHWIGVTFLDRALFARAGRIQLPYGLRNVEHSSLVRDQTQTGLALDQQHGFALAYNGELFRGEVMAVLGNLQVQLPRDRIRLHELDLQHDLPALVKQKGYAGFVEIAPLEGLAIGVSSRLLNAAPDLELGVDALRHAHGLHARWAPLREVVVLAEGDATFVHTAPRTFIGGAGWLQVDVEPWQGIHFMPALEARHAGDPSLPPAAGAWMSMAWFPLPHTELRVDGIYKQLFSAQGLSTGSFTGLLQAHFYL